MVVVGIEMMMIVTWLGPTIEVVGVASVGVIWSLGGLVGEVVSGERERERMYENDLVYTCTYIYNKGWHIHTCIHTE